MTAFQAVSRFGLPVSARGKRPPLRLEIHSLKRGALAVAVLLAGIGNAAAEPLFARQYKQTYGYTPSCNACHKDGGGTPLNLYGEQFKEAGMNLAAFATIAELDADDDGANNQREAEGKANPGSARSTPSAPGDWLDIESLIPKEVQALFPGISSYLPRDAILTESDIQRAAAMGVRLSESDQNTIYIPVENRRPAGTALIFPVYYDNRSFFLLLATDRRLNVLAVKPLNTRLVPEAMESTIYGGFEGEAVNELPSARGANLDAAVTNAVKKAGTLLWVRLKGA